MKTKLTINRLIAIAFCFVASLSMYGATITVTSTADSGAGTLRDAVAAAVDGDVIIFDASTNGTAIVLTSGAIAIDDNITIAGNGIDNTEVSGGNASGVFTINADDVLFQLFSITNGNAANGAGALVMGSTSLTLKGMSFTSNEATGDMATNGGGAIYLMSGTSLTSISNTTYTLNSASGISGSGGAIHAADGSSYVVRNNTFDQNTSMRAGGAIEDATNSTGFNKVTNSMFTTNDAGSNPGNGGAIHISGSGNLSIGSSTATGNIAGSEGGAYWNNAGTMFVQGGAVQENTANGTAADNGGGGLFNNGGTLNVFDVDVVGNQAINGSGSGGGILNGDGGTLSVRNSLISGNTSARAGGGIEDASGASGGLLAISTTVSNNNAGSAPGNGGGVHISGPGNSTFGTCMIMGNTAVEGGGLWNNAGTMTVQGGTISGNTATGDDLSQGGGGIFNEENGTLRVYGGTMIMNNSATGDSGSGGGLLSVEATSFTVTDATFTGNSASRAGGAIEDQSNNTAYNKIINTTFDSNTTGSAPGNGGAIHITGTANMSINNSVAVNNVAAREGGAYWNGAGIMFIKDGSITDNEAQGPSADDGGGGVFNNGGILNILDVDINNNSATGAAGSGGGVFNAIGGMTRINASSLNGNTSNRAGGAIEDASGAGTEIQLVNSTFSNNDAGASPGNGGALHISGDGDAAVVGSTFNDNTATEGGALWNGAGRMIVSGSDFTDNEATGDDLTEGGGAIWNLTGGMLEVRNGSTFTTNSATGASGSGGAILNREGASFKVSNSTFTSNSASRAGGAIEDQSMGMASTPTMVIGSTFNTNSTGSAPGNGGAIHITGSGSMTIKDCTADGNTAAAEGGAYWNGSGNMSIIGGSMTNNIASGNDADNGGGALFNVSGNLIVSNATISGNLADGTSGSGGAALSLDGKLRIVESLVQNNSANRAGGAVEVVDGSLEIARSEFYDNDVSGTAGTPNPGSGGAVHVTGTSGTTTGISRSTFNGNTAENQGGALWNQSGSTMTVNVSTITENSIPLGATGASVGGGIYNNGGVININTSTIALNNSINGGGYGSASGSVLNIGSTILASNGGVLGVDIADAGTTNSNDYNIIGQDDQGVFTPAVNDQEGTIVIPLDPMLMPLADNGGPTMTHAIDAGSIAVDQGDPAITYNDQRLSALVNTRDVGAYEADLSAFAQLSTESTLVDAVPGEIRATVYPNPATSDNLNIKLNQDIEEAVTIEIIDLSGNIIFTDKMSDVERSVSLFNVRAGTYILRTISKTAVTTETIHIR